MPLHKVGIGHDVAEVSLSTLTPQPKGDPLAPTVRNYAPGGAFHEQGQYTCHHYDFLEDADQFEDVLNEYGLISDDRQDITFMAYSERMVWTRYNGTAIRPEMGQDVKFTNFFIRDVAIYIVDVEEAA